MSDNFKTCGEAWRYCEKYGLNNITAGHSFQIAAALLRAYQDGAKEHSTAPDSEGDATCTCNGLPHMPTCPLYGIDKGDIMIRAVCQDCGYVFWAAVIMGENRCPKCGSENIYIAISVGK